jgi:anti-sigma regulatory factor (Ser/Thr protein kinase)
MGVFKAEFDPDPAQAREARRFVRAVLGDREVAETAELLVSELTANVIRHARTPFRVEIESLPETVRVSIWDGQAVDLVISESTDPQSESGRGLRIVQALAKEWGAERTPEGKRVWFELARQ